MCLNIGIYTWLNSQFESSTLNWTNSMRIDIVIKENRRFYLAGERRTFNSEFKL